jgi:hypothetical protein
MPALKGLGVAGASLAITLSGLVLAAPAADAAATGIYKNCTTLHTKWRHGVGKATAHDVTSGRPVTTFLHSNRQFRIAMSHNRGLDRDKDGIACEQA